VFAPLLAETMMSRARTSWLVALALSLAVHAGLMWSPAFLAVRLLPPPPPPIEAELQVEPPPKIVPPPRPAKVEKSAPAASTPLATPASPPASLDAPPPPSAEEWKLASTYTLRNSKRYRNAWGQQVRSMMGTAVAGPDQGQVRFRITVAPDGSIAQVEELWSTSEMASQLAWKAIRSMPPLPPTPTGKPLVFEQTISFLPYETGWPPSYKLDCLPEPEAFKNPFAWDGASPQQVPITSQAHRPPPPGDCIPDSTADTIEEEERELKRQMEQWRWGS
jgi:TonB family protein